MNTAIFKVIAECFCWKNQQIRLLGYVFVYFSLQLYELCLLKGKATEHVHYRFTQSQLCASVVLI